MRGGGAKRVRGGACGLELSAGWAELQAGGGERGGVWAEMGGKAGFGTADRGSQGLPGPGLFGLGTLDVSG